MNEKVISWIIPRLSAYRSVGFFTQFGDLSDMALFQRLSTFEDDFGENRMRQVIEDVSATEYEGLIRRFPYRNFLNEMWLLPIDNQRVWAGDMECDASEGVYTEHLEKWSHISRQAFLPKMITERWVDDNGWVDVDFTLGEAKHSMRAKINDDWLDPDIVPQINRAIENSGFQFCYSLVDQHLYTFVLTETERKQLATALHWQFDGSGYFEPKIS